MIIGRANGARSETMMEESKFERFLIFFLLCLLPQSTYAQKDFVSIACCATRNYTDPRTGIDWVTDLSWFPDKSNCRKTSKNPPSNANHHEARVFLDIEQAGKQCYRLETAEGEEYLMRGTFLYYGESTSPRIMTSFSIVIGVTSIGEVSSSVEDNLEIEGIFKAKGEYVDFCLVRRERAPYMSTLVLRPLNGLEYLGDSSSNVLRLIKRLNLGASQEDFIKYPDDPSDRIWKPDPTKTNATKVNGAQVLNYQSKARAPLQVLRTALEDPTLLVFSHEEEPSDASNSSHYRVILYFLELRSAVKPGQRLFDIVVNGETRYAGFDVLGGGSNYKEVALEVNANGALEVSLVRASGSALGPICNAYEIFRSVSWVDVTKVNDVSAIMEVKREILEFNRNNKIVRSWSGDPCLPQPWKGLFCESVTNLTVITKLSMSSMDLSGPIPPSITKLTNLNTLNMSSNKLSGQIPGFPSTSMLRLIDLRNNDLEGPLPEDLPMLSHLETLYIGCNPIVKEEDESRINTSKLDTSSESCTEKGRDSSKRYKIIASLACGSLIILAGIMIFWFYKRKLMPQRMFKDKDKDKGHKRHKDTKKNTGPLIIKLPIMQEIVVKSIKIQTFTLAQIEAATESYKTLIGEGGFGSVYRGTLSDGQEVAVKVRSATSTQGTREFENELNLLSTIFHENLVPLFGFCSENDQEILVYPFMSNGSLQDRLCGDASRRKKLDWPTRLSIALGAARGLAHLHTYCGRGIIHRDVKSSNILLDHSMNAKVADFGFSKYAPQEGDSCASLEVRGTAGYLDPEYYTTHHLSDKSDVFSFGVVLLEIISGREPLNIRRERSEWSLVEWAKQQVRDSNIDEIVDPSIKGGYHSEAMWRVVEVSLLCVEPYSAYRPCMTDVMRELEDALIIENNASEYMRSIESSGSVVLDKKLGLVSTPTDASPIPMLALPPPEPR